MYVKHFVLMHKMMAVQRIFHYPLLLLEESITGEGPQTLNQSSSAGTTLAAISNITVMKLLTQLLNLSSHSDITRGKPPSRAALTGKQKVS